MTETAANRLPGDPGKEALVARMIRVDHAGEYGARRIYEGQMAVLKNRSLPGHKAVRPGDIAAIAAMHAQELQHLKTFEDLIAERRVRPSLLHPLWHAAGFALGAATALLGAKAAMACTVAVEEVIDEHYQAQATALGADEDALRQTIEAFRADEVHHRDTGIAHGAKETPGYALLTHAIKSGARLAIWLAERV